VERAGRLTLDGDVQLGELRRFSVAEISDSGRGMPLFDGELVGVFFEMRNGSVTCKEDSVADTHS